MQQRPIKFRAWDKEGEEYAKVDLLCVSQDGKVWEFDPSLFNPMHEITSRIILEQFTGMLDGADTAVYEGDIIEKDAKRGEVWFNPFAARFYIDPSQGLDLDIAYIREAVVIGNVHENPDLLESGAKRQEA